MATKQSKGLTPKSAFITLAKGVKEAEKAPVMAWLAVFREFVKSGEGDKKAFAHAWQVAVRGTDYDLFTENTVRQSISLIEWAENNIKGGARACHSMNHIVKQRAESNAKPKAQAVARRVNTVTITNDEFARALRKAGIAPELIALAERAVFVTAK